MIYKTIIFDFDGTIADTMEEGRRIFNIIAPDQGIRTIDRQEMEEMRGFSINQFIQHMGIPKTKIPVFIARGSAMMRKSIGGLPLIRGIGEVLAEMRPKVDRFGILTSNEVANVEIFLKSHDMGHLFDFIWSTSKLTGKSRYLNSAKKKFGLKSGEMIYVGDEVRDLKAAKKAGIAFAGVTWGFNSHAALEAEGPDFLVDSPAQLLGLAGN